jgi:uncharacterized membrane protein
MMFEGLSRFVPAAVIMIIQTIPFLIAGAVLVGFGFIEPRETPDTLGPMSPEQMNKMMSEIAVPLIVAYSAAFPIFVLIKSMLFFAMPLVAEHDLRAGEAVVLSVKAAVNNFGGIIMVIILQIALGLLGLLLLIVGVFFVIPVIHAAEVAAYRQVFHAAVEETPESGPAPGDYDDDFPPQ